MNKQALITMHPEYALDILNGRKTLELRTWNLGDYVGWVNVYVAKRKPYIWFHKCSQEYEECDLSLSDERTVNGRVAFRFWYDGYDRVKRSKNAYGDFINDVDFYEQGVGWVLPKDEETYRQKLCLTKQEIIDYIKNKECYAWHINKLEIFDKPKELGEFVIFKKQSVYVCRELPPYNDTIWVGHNLYKAPQSWQYVYVKGE